MQAWMFTGTFVTFRERLFRSSLIASLLHLGPRAFDSISGEVVQTVAFVARNSGLLNTRGVYFDLTAGRSEAAKIKQLQDAIAYQGRNNVFRVEASSFCEIPGAPVAYWLPRQGIEAFAKGKRLDSFCTPKKGMTTSDNARFIRRWTEVALGRTSIACPEASAAMHIGRKWFPYNKGGGYRKWYGNNEFVINWEDDGREVVTYAAKLYGSASRQIQNVDYYFRPSVTWSEVSSGFVAGREQPSGYIFDSTGPSIFGTESGRVLALSLLCTNIADMFARALNPTLHLTVRNVASLPVPSDASGSAIDNLAITVRKCVALATSDWNAYERSWDFQSFPVLTASAGSVDTLESSYTVWITQNRATIAEMKRLEEENNRFFIDAYGLTDELTPNVPIEQITLTVNPAYRYGGGLAEEEQWTRFRQDTMAELISYAIGCMMGRYSLDEPGLIYAHAGNVGFDALRYKSFPADADGIVPITDELWFEDDAANRVCEFLRSTWGVETLDQNLAFLAANLGAKGNETPAEVIRRYLASQFFRDHLQTYKRRPIYWLFSSGKQGAFQALVYLHRYHEGMLARMRAEYVVPLIGKMQSRIGMLEKDRDAASSTPARNKIAKQIETLKKKHLELLAYDEKLRHYADMRIKLDLDNGVKVNYGKFGDLLAEAKAVTGGASDE
jgi:hypothetical protein